MKKEAANTNNNTNDDDNNNNYYNICNTTIELHRTLVITVTSIGLSSPLRKSVVKKVKQNVFASREKDFVPYFNYKEGWYSNSTPC